MPTVKKRRKRRVLADGALPTEKPGQPIARPAWPRVFLAGVLVIGVGLLGYMAWEAWWGGQPTSRSEAASAPAELTLENIPFNGQQAYEYLKQLCQIGPRPSGSDGMRRQQELLAEHFRKLGGQVELQRFEMAHPVDGSRVPMANLIVRWHPDRPVRVLLSAHYDTLPFPMLDPQNPKGRFVGANDGASGVAVLMELGRHMPELKSRYGVDFAFWDGEEFIFDPSHEYFRGSTYFAQEYRRQPKRGYSYRWGVLLDMVGDKDLQIYQEGYSMQWRETRPLVAAIWATARRLGVREFIPRVKHYVRDDHLPLFEIGGIPTCDIIDFDYPAWHTQADTPEQCSPLSLAKVGWVLLEWLRSLK
jgi:hypothetical protein